MCGIAGVFDFRKREINPKIIKAMTDAIKHRGPDGEGLFIDGNLGLGHRRLAIIDLSPAGHQPKIDPSNRYVISYNGELYNYRELRSELEIEGFKFNSNTDTEVILNAYIAWGENSLNRFNGMFAYVIWDKLKRELFIARDRYGIKPLYYYLNNDLLVFSSEIKGILAHPEYKNNLDKNALYEYLTFQNFFSEDTLFSDVKIFPAGSFAKLNEKNSSMSPVQYWDFNFSETETYATEAEYIEEIDRLFNQAVNRQLVSDVEVGSYLSGGIDSGAITAIAAKQLPCLRTFTCGFDLRSASGIELGFDEREKAERLSYLFKTEQYEIVLKSGDMERIMPAFSRQLEEPRVGQSYPNYYIAQLASKFVKVVLSGVGGDELFAGYPWRYYRALENVSLENYITKYYNFWQRLLPNEQLNQLITPISREIDAERPHNIFRSIFSQEDKKLTSVEECISQSLRFEAKTFLHGLLVIEDKLTMAHGLEMRVPFLDNDLVDFAMKIPAHYKLGNLRNVEKINENSVGDKTSQYYQRYHDGKLILRKVMSKYIPDDIVQGQKQGFSAPDASWFKGESIEYVKKIVYNRSARIYNYFDPAVTQKIVEDHLAGRNNNRLFIWSLINLENWLEQFM